MTQEMLIMAAILVAVILLTFIGILSRYRKCKSDEVLVVYGKTGGDKKSAKLYHGGAAFVWPIIQGYEFLSMKPMQIECKLTGALSAQNIRVDVPTTITVAISTVLTPELIEEGFVREVISKVQTMRKDSGFEVMDHITVSVSGSEKVMAVVDKNREAISHDVLADDIVLGENVGNEKDWDINGEKVSIGVKKN